MWRIGSLVSVLLLCVACARGAEVVPPGPVPRDTLVTVKHDGSAFVIGMVAGKFVPVPTHECPGALVFTGAPGSYLVLVVEGEQRFQSVVEIVDGMPTPPGPDPPKPDPVVPDSVLRACGIGPAVYLETLKTGATTGDIQRLAAAYQQSAVYLHELRMTPAGAQEQLRKVRGELSGAWSSWEKTTEASINAAIGKHGSGQAMWRDYCREIASALNAAVLKRMQVQR